MNAAAPRHEGATTMSAHDLARAASAAAASRAALSTTTYIGLDGHRYQKDGAAGTWRAAHSDRCGCRTSEDW